MISIVPTYNRKFRAFGWVQDPSNLRSLCDVVAVFAPCSAKHREMVDSVIPRLVAEQDGRGAFIEALRLRPLKLKYAHLVGTSFTPRSASRCNGIIQAAVKGQGRDFIVDWPADNFVRWAHCFGFIKYDYADDSFEITDSGLELVRARGAEEALSEKEKELLINAALAYPPVVRVLSLLSETEDTHLTKFEIGRQLGFIGEDGFTSMPQKVFVRSLANAEATERSTMKANWEGSSDKYARMIAKWLENLGLVMRVSKEVTVWLGEKSYTDTIAHSYIITAPGITALRRSVGKSRHKRIAKNVCWEMLATKGADREYLRTRRALILKCLSESSRRVSDSKIINFLESNGFKENNNTVADDIRGLQNIGIAISVKDGKYLFDDVINDFVIPLPQSLAKSDFVETKERIRDKLLHLPHEYLSLIDLAYDSKQNRLFEMKTLGLLTEECGYHGLHLGGSRKPDGIIYTDTERYNYGVIIDTKAYSRGYNLPISQADEMERYIGENQTRDVKINPNKWWEYFPADVEEFYFMFVSGHFIGNFRSQIERISRNKAINGTAIAVANLLLCVEAYKAGELTHEAIKTKVFNNGEFELS
ncbi:restriction endonuclease FokI C-terminal domain-containing protein [Cloacibacillus sp. An23]|uniref:restriction endonuclease FokI C-terminal domain-containing protein n=1 Tax=Cloacibacillus sp. An23 TaxID=1965591 RepID=UPI000B3871A1|nr:restriction endonuclease FokI C-terminal domain-containing protein [Cloacibacillus sp. An23]OUO94488.1 hypothetical protein B5F39_04115 [Cloacibacillus sp. An23]